MYLQLFCMLAALDASSCSEEWQHSEMLKQAQTL
jgi:hypothetical protein